jgi:hypothetical protein
MNVFLWMLQVALTWFCIAGGVFQIFKIEQLKKAAASMRALPRGLWAFFGVLSLLAGVCLIVPGAIGLLPVLTPIAAAVVSTENIVISAIYVRYGDRAPLTYSAVIAIVAAFIAYGRFVLRPL